MVKKFEITKSEVANLLSVCKTYKEAYNTLGISKPTLRKICRTFGLKLNKPTLNALHPHLISEWDYEKFGLIEYQGEQHYKPTRIHGANKRFIELVKRDVIESNYCIKRSLRPLIIPYWESITNLLKDFTRGICG